jgi:hypothetical protein
LLCSILDQNTDIYASGISVVAGVLWNNYHILSDDNIIKYIAAQNRQDYPRKLMNSSIDSYYSITDKRYVIDKNRTWTLPGNKMVLEKYIDPNPKILVTTRGVEDVFKSLLNIYIENGSSMDLVLENFWNKSGYGSIDFFKSYAGIMSAYLNNETNSYLFIGYDSLVEDTDVVIKNVYDFFDIDYFDHNFSKIKKMFQEDDSVWNLNGLHDVRDNLKKRNINIEIPDKIKEYCDYIQKLVDDAKSGNNLEEVNDFININFSL